MPCFWIDFLNSWKCSLLCSLFCHILKKLIWGFFFVFFFWLVEALHTFFKPLPFHLFVSFYLKCISCRQHRAVLLFYWIQHSSSGICRPFIFNVVTNMFVCSILLLFSFIISPTFYLFIFLFFSDFFWIEHVL